jgi:hypothetical protein
MTASHPARLDLKLRDLAQLFNSMDPSPFLERDLDGDAEEYIVSSCRELTGAGEFELVIHLVNAPDPERAANTQEAVRHYFASRAELKRREFRQLLRRGRTSLIVGLLFLAACLALSGLAVRLSYAPVAGMVQTSLSIVGWVAMWRPLEIYLYDWWPLREEWQDLRRLARMRVRIVLPPAAGAVPAGAAPASQ